MTHPTNEFIEKKVEEFNEIFPVFQVRNYTSDSIIGEFDSDGNLLPSTEVVRQDFSLRMKAFLRAALQEAYAAGEAFGAANYRAHYYEKVTEEAIQADRAEMRKKIEGMKEDLTESQQQELPSSRYWHITGYENALDKVLDLFNTP